LPNIPQSALDTIRGTVRLAVRVSVDSAGDVSDAQIESSGPSKYFANLALAAARQWKFSPASGAPGDRILHFELRQSGSSASVSPAGSN
jgi:TonB family protein